MTSDQIDKVIRNYLSTLARTGETQGSPHRARQAGAHHVGRGDPSGADAAAGRRTGCRSRTGGCARGLLYAQMSEDGVLDDGPF